MRREAHDHITVSDSAERSSVLRHTAHDHLTVSDSVTVSLSGGVAIAHGGVVELTGRSDGTSTMTGALDVIRPRREITAAEQCLVGAVSAAVSMWLAMDLGASGAESGSAGVVVCLALVGVLGRTRKPPPFL